MPTKGVSMHYEIHAHEHLRPIEPQVQARARVEQINLLTVLVVVKVLVGVVTPLWLLQALDRAGPARLVKGPRTPLRRPPRSCGAGDASRFCGASQYVDVTTGL